jgi:PKD repeat protein
VYTPAVGAWGTKKGNGMSMQLLEVTRARKALRAVLCGLALGFVGLTAYAQPSMNRALNLLQAAPDGSWVQLSTNRLETVWTPPELRPSDTFNPQSVISAWGGLAWDTARGKLYAHGGGHANYPGNEVYSWDIVSGAWSRASLPSRLVQVGTTGRGLGAYMPIDGPQKTAPMPCHQYAAPTYLPVVDRVVYFCGAGYQRGETYVYARADGSLFYPGPFFWDPSKADGLKVGGAQDSHVNTSPLYASPTSIAAGNMWQGRGLWENIPVGGVGAPAFLNSAASYRNENGSDVLYVAAQNDNGSTALFLHRYVINSANNPAADTWTRVGTYWNGYASGQGGSVIHPVHNIFIKPSGSGTRFMYWSLAPTAMANSTTNRDEGIFPVVSGGATFANVDNSSLTWDSKRNRIVIWQGGSAVWSLTAPATLVNGTWTLDPVPVTGAGGPTIIPTQGVQNRFKYVAELDAYVALVEGTDGTVWAYKPANWERPGGPNVPPSVAITTPANGASYTAPAAIGLTANATDTDGTVTKVQYFIGGVSAGQATSAPWTVNWTNVPAGSYSITAVATDNAGDTTTSAPVAITVAPAANVPPVARIVVTPSLSGNTATSFSLSGETSTDSDGTIASYAWNFGDGTTATGSATSKVYSTPGSYTVQLTVTDNRGGTHTASATITVANRLPTVSISGPVNNATFTASATVSLSALASDPDGTVAKVEYFVAGASVGSSLASPWSVTWSNVASGAYSITAVATDNRGGTTVSSPVSISVSQPSNFPPVARVTVSPASSGTTATNFTLSGATSTDSDGSIASYAWIFGDGTSATGASVAKQYTAAGTYTVQLTVTDNVGATHTASTTITVSLPSNVPPMARITVSPGPSGTTATTFALSGASSTDSDGTIASYQWQFGDGTTGTGVSVNKQYAAEGTYTAQLTVTDNAGAVSIASVNLVVTVATAPQISYTKTVSATVANGTVTAVTIAGVSVPFTVGANGAFTLTITVNAPQTVAVLIEVTESSNVVTTQTANIVVP